MFTSSRRLGDSSSLCIRLMVLDTFMEDTIEVPLCIMDLEECCLRMALVLPVDAHCSGGVCCIHLYMFSVVDEVGEKNLP